MRRVSKIMIPVFFFGCFLQQSGAKDTKPATGSRGMVSSAHPLATEAGLKILKEGGNAFDAAVAIASTLNVVEPMMSGMGGYGTILIYDAKKNRVRYLDSSGKIPMALNSDVFRAPTPNYMQNRRGPKSVSTPGNVNAWEAMSKEYGNLKWNQLFEPAIATAENGFPISKRFMLLLEMAYASFPDHAKKIYGINGHALQTNDLLVQRQLANSLRLVARHGSRIFYEGELAKKIHQEMQTQQSFLSLADLKADKAEWWNPIRIRYNGYDVYTSSPPSTAYPSLILLGMMSTLKTHRFDHNSVDYLHYFAEVSKLAFRDRLQYAGDPEMTPPPLRKLLSKKYWEEQVSKIDPQQATDFRPPVLKSPTSDNTSHFVVADRWGNIVSATQTLGNLFGSRIMPRGTGIWFNNSLAYCTFEPKGNPMDAKPGQRKLSGDCPTIIFKAGKPWAALGTPGGHTIGQTVPQMVMNLIDFKMDMAEAIAAPRVSFVEPNSLFVGNGIKKSVIEGLKQRGHNVIPNRRLGNAHGLKFVTGKQGKHIGYEGAADPRGDGTAKGY